MKNDIDILNEIGLEQLKIIHEKEEHEPIKLFAENMIYRVESGNSNVSYEQADKLLQYNGDDDITFEEMLKFINRKLWKFNRCISKKFFTNNKSWFSRCKTKGRYRKLDAMIAVQRIIDK